jgi:hypothetical protein
MRFMTMVKASENQGPPPQALMEAMGLGAEQAARRGTLVESAGLAPTASSKRVRLEGGRITVSDGPFTESKEVIGGYAVLETASLEEAVENAVWLMTLHREHWPGWAGEVEVRQIFGPEDFGAPAEALAAGARA